MKSCYLKKAHTKTAPVYAVKNTDIADCLKRPSGNS